MDRKGLNKGNESNVDERTCKAMQDLFASKRVRVASPYEARDNDRT